MAEAHRPARARIEAELDALVTENRFTIAVVFPAFGAVLLLASAEMLLGPLGFNPYLVLFGTLVMRLPLIAGLAPLVDRKAAAGLLGLALYAYVVEYVGTTTGLPYGPFEYGVDLGPMLLGKVPFALPIFFFPLVVNAYLLMLLLLGDRAERTVVRLVAVVATVLLMDVVLDPGAVALGFWSYDLDAVVLGVWPYDAPGDFYGVPWSNYAGWVLSATVAVATLDWAFSRAGLRRRLAACEFMLDDLVSFVILWGAVNAYFGQWLPVAFAALLGVGLWKTDRFDVPLPPWLSTQRVASD
ncbi:bisanhydrobacterioruberin hydratase CruF [Halorarius litoreus]|uniref:bisanhydrobacterioruberin hydratase CruF n=1 Tax=Halorarius litoreus TaxID=2962676 RepID=UPI0020CEA3D7|nr:bisanhydrobacterioruberin hydratase CruF [Halorarius litoreus]